MIRRHPPAEDSIGHLREAASVVQMQNVGILVHEKQPQEVIVVVQQAIYRGRRHVTSNQGVGYYSGGAIGEIDVIREHYLGSQPGPMTKKRS